MFHLHLLIVEDHAKHYPGMELRAEKIPCLMLVHDLPLSNLQDESVMVL
jgi:hypothetical protein